MFNRWQYLVVQNQEMKMNMSKKKPKKKDLTANLVKTALKHKVGYSSLIVGELQGHEVEPCTHIGKKKKPINRPSSIYKIQLKQ